MYQTKVVAAASLALLAHARKDITCNALVLSGGANLGAWEVGVMWGLAMYGNQEDYHWDVVSGISAGAINAAGTAGFSPDEVIEMNQYLSDSWYYQRTADIW